MILASKNPLRNDEPCTSAQVTPEIAGRASATKMDLARYLPHLSRMSNQLKETSAQIENAVVGVCNSFHGIAQRVQETVARTTGFLSRDDKKSSGRPSFEALIENCSNTLVKILSATEETGKISRQAIERIQQIEKVSQGISSALVELDQIAEGNKMLALNARIEAAHAGSQGAGFAAVAVEVVALTDRSQKVTGQVSGLIATLRTLAGSTLKDLARMSEQEHSRVQQSRREVDESLKEMQAVHGEMKTMLTGMNEDSAVLANEIGAAVRGMQFQDRTSQRIAHVVDDLKTLHEKLAVLFDIDAGAEEACDQGFSCYTMQEERVVAGIHGAESGAGEIELF